MSLRLLKRCLYLIENHRHLSTQICVVGSGPAGFYFAQHLIKGFKDVQIDMYEQLPVPFGLVRYGVAPDHPEVKNVIHTFTKTASLKNFRFIGNVSLGKDITMQELKNSYHAVVLAYGCSEDSKLNIPGESLGNVLSARKFVGWYNGLPCNRDLNVDLNCDSAIILGQGNVAIDVARILVTPIDTLKTTDITSYSLAKLSKSQIKKVYLVGRRGPLQVAFTIKEFREMTKLPGVGVELLHEQFEGIEEIVPGLPRARKRLTELLLKTLKEGRRGDKTFKPVFFKKPLRINGHSSAASVEFAVNKLTDNLKGLFETTNMVENIDCGLVFRSIGYKGCCADEGISFDKNTCTISSGNGVYSTGWISTGPVGVILSTMNDAFGKSEMLISDIASKKLNILDEKAGFEEIKRLLLKRGIQTVSFSGWEKIDAVEIERGKPLGKPREKIVDIKEMLHIGGDDLPL